jgi:hypothetical protein
VSRSRSRVPALAAVAAVVAIAPAPRPAAAAAASSTLYVSTYASSTNGDTSCQDAGYTSIQSAVDDAPSGGTVVVCPAKVYRESVTIDEPLTLSSSGAVINAAGQSNGYAVGVAASNVTVEGLHLAGARADSASGGPGDGLAVLPTPPPPGFASYNAASLTLADDTFVNNEHAGIDLDGTYDALVVDDRISANGVGVLLSSRTARSEGNVISGNLVVGNRTGAGIELSDITDHVIDNRVTGNVVEGNGYQGHGNQGQGAGILLTISGEGSGMSGTTIRGNTVTHNSLAGIAVKAGDLAHPPYWHDNVVRGNVIGANDIGPGHHPRPGSPPRDYAGPRTTAIYADSTVPIWVQVRANTIKQDTHGITTAGPVRLRRRDNSFRDVRHHLTVIPRFQP